MTAERSTPAGVLHVIDTYRIGGPGKTIINAASFVDPARYGIHVASFTPGTTGRSEFADAVRAAGIPYLELGETRRFNLRHVQQLRDYVRGRGIRILHAHGYRSDVLCYLAAARLPGVAIVTSHHGWIRNSVRQRVFSRMAIALASRFDGIACVSGRLLEEIPGWVRRRTVAMVVHNGLVLEDYLPRGERDQVRRALGAGEQDILIGVVGRLSVEKGTREMLEAFAEVLRAHPGARLMFVGEGPEQEHLREQIEARGLSQRVRLLGHWHPIQPFYEAVDLIVSPSRTEGLSNVILEALAFRRPIVATRVGGNDEILEHGVTGILVPAQDPAALAQGLLALLGDPARASRLAEQGHRRLVNDFGFRARMAREQAFYDRVLHRPSNSAGTVA